MRKSAHIRTLLSRLKAERRTAMRKKAKTTTEKRTYLLYWTRARKRGIIFRSLHINMSPTRPPIDICQESVCVIICICMLVTYRWIKWNEDEQQNRMLSSHIVFFFVSVSNDFYFIFFYLAEVTRKKCVSRIRKLRIASDERTYKGKIIV